jgi:insecticidal toxin complex protein TccC
LPVRAVGYWRDIDGVPPQARVNRTVHDWAGRAVAQWDPRLFLDPSAPANLQTVYALSGAVLSTSSVDAGWRVALSGEAGQAVQHLDGRGTRWMQYDVQQRPVSVFEQAMGGEAVCVERLGYGLSDQISAEHNQCGQLIRHDDPAGTQLFAEFGLHGTVLEQTRHFLDDLTQPDWPESIVDRDLMWEPGESATSRSHLNAAGDVVKQTDAKGHRQLFHQTLDGQLREVRLQLKADPTAKTLVGSITYNAHGQTEREVAGNGVITTLKYDEQNGRLIRLLAQRGNEALQDLHHEYDAKGNVRSILDAALPIRYFANQRIEPISRYTYDSLSQLIEATGWEAGSASKGPQLSTFDDPAPRANYRQVYRYDAGGNLLELIHEGPQSHGHRMLAATHSNRCLPVLEGVEPGEDDFRLGFDGNGNLLNLQPGQALAWDLRNQLCEVRPVERDSGLNDRERYVYGADGMRLRKVREAYTNARTLIAETRYLPNLELRTNSGTGEMLQVISVQAGLSSVRVLHWESKDSANDQYRYHLNDHLGSCTLELDKDGEVISQERYHPYGSTAWFAGRGEVEASYRTVRYSGKERDATGLYYYGFRYYVAGWQRWLNPDPAGDVDGLNFYCMVQSNPVSFKDDDGRQSDFSKYYKPEQGDLIFGLAKVLDQGYLSWRAALTGRGDYLAKYLDGDDIARLEKGLDPLRHSYSSIRDSTRRLALSSPGTNDNGSSNRFWEGQYSSVAELVFRKEGKYYENIKTRYGGVASTAANKQFSENYADAFSSGHYSVRKTFEKYVDADDKFGQKLISRASKAGLSTILNSGRTDVIHFTLDGLDMEQVVMKTRPSATSSELRYLFRNREKLADKVLFYRKNMLVDAPWRTDRAEWSRYTPKSASSNTLLSGRQTMK